MARTPKKRKYPLIERIKICSVYESADGRKHHFASPLKALQESHVLPEHKIEGLAYGDRDHAGRTRFIITHAAVSWECGPGRDDD